LNFLLQSEPDIQVLTPQTFPDPREATGWSFPDTEDGIVSTLERGATHLWANKILFASHPLQISSRIGVYQDIVGVVGQPPCMVELYDDKQFVNALTSPMVFSLPSSQLFVVRFLSP
jgi:hypothetical protein